MASVAHLPGRAKWLFVVMAAAISAMPLAFVTYTWVHVAPVPVQLWLDAPANSKLSVSWDAQTEHTLPLVPNVVPGQARATLWLGELPARPRYDLRLNFESSQDGAVLQEVKLIDTCRPGEPLFRAGAEEFEAQFVAKGVACVRSGDRLSVQCPAGSSLSLPALEFPSRRATTLTFAKLWLLLALALSVAGLYLLPMFQPAPDVEWTRDDGQAGRSFGVGLWPLWLAFGAGMALHLAVTAKLPALVNEFDPLVYFHKAAWLVELGSYDTNWNATDIDRLPGYPAFLAGCFRLFGYRLQSVTLVQGALFGLALLVLALSLRPWVSPWFTGAAVFLMLASPVYLMMTRCIATESVFASLAALSLAAFFQHVAAQERHPVLWLAIHGVIVAAAVFVRANGIVLLGAPLAAYVSAVVGLLCASRGMRDRLQGLAGCSAQHAVPFAVVALGLCTWSLRNYYHHGMFAPTSMVGVSWLEGLMQSGIIEPKALWEEQLYTDYVREKYAAEYTYTGWTLRDEVMRQMRGRGSLDRSDATAVLDQRLRGIAARSQAQAPWQLRAAGWLRTGFWAWRLPPRDTYARSLIRWPNDFCANNPVALGAWKRFCEEHCVERLHKKLLITDLGGPPPALWAQTYVTLFDRPHFRGYSAFLLAGILSGAVLVWTRGAVFATPALVFIANVTLNNWLLNIHGRYILCFELLVVFQTAVGLGMLWRAWRARQVEAEGGRQGGWAAEGRAAAA